MPQHRSLKWNTFLSNNFCESKAWAELDSLLLDFTCKVSTRLESYLNWGGFTYKLPWLLISLSFQTGPRPVQWKALVPYWLMTRDHHLQLLALWLPPSGRSQHRSLVQQSQQESLLVRQTLGSYGIAITLPMFVLLRRESKFPPTIKQSRGADRRNYTSESTSRQGTLRTIL